MPNVPNPSSKRHCLNRHKYSRHYTILFMSENPSTPADSNDTPAIQQNGTEEATSANKNNVIPIATKKINDVIQFQEPTTSKNYSFKTEIRINILGEPEGSQGSFETNDSISLNLFGDCGAKEAKEPMEVEESFTTMDNCVKEKMTSTNEPVMFSRNERTQRAIVVSEAPPPYDSRPPPAYSTSPYYSGQPYNPPGTGSGPGRVYYSYELDSSSFLDQHVRHHFVKKVFTILSVQLMITTGFILLVMFHQPSRKFVSTNIAMFWIMVALELVVYFVLVCYQITRRIFPLNFVLLLLFTIALSYICATATVFYSTKIILLTAASTALICLIVSILACQTWFDITKWSFIIAIAALILLVFGLVVMIVTLVTQSKVLWLVFAGLATALFAVFLLYDMQCILGGRRLELSPEEYIFGALTLYVDIVMIFMYMLELINACGS